MFLGCWTVRKAKKPFVGFLVGVALALLSSVAQRDTPQRILDDGIANGKRASLVIKSKLAGAQAAVRPTLLLFSACCRPARRRATTLRVRSESSLCCCWPWRSSRTIYHSPLFGMPEDSSSVVCCVTLQSITLKLTLSPKLLSSKTLENGVLNPL
jgi:hypothetical protein